MAGDNKKLNVF